MKKMILLVMAFVFVNTNAFAVGQTTTECTMMREEVNRNNPKGDKVPNKNNNKNIKQEQRAQ